jgi:DNA-binding transcriptional regulator YiaG
LYQISNTGRVKSLHYNKIRFLKPNTVCGYYQVALSLGNKTVYKKIHRLVAEAFLNPVKDKYYVNHIDANKLNNHVTNLEYCNMAENNKHAGNLNLKPIGTNHTNSKLTHIQLKKIRELLQEKKLSHKQISELFDVHRTTVSKIYRNESYSKEST